MGERAFFVCVWKRRCPIVRHRAPGILPGLRLLAEITQHRIDTALKRELARPNCFLDSLPFSIGSQSLELFVRIEYQGGPWKTAGLSRAVGMHTNNVKGLARETEGKVRIKRIARNVLVPVEIFPVGAMQLPELSP